jgi:hypothetical protein
MVFDPRAYELFSEGSTGGGLVNYIPGLGKAQSFFNDLLFKDMIPRLKMQMAKVAFERNKEAYAADLASGKINEDQLMALTASESNAAFGEQNYRMLGRSPVLQDFLRITLLAPDFLEARARFVGRALMPYGKEQRVALGLMAATVYVGARIINTAVNGDPLWQHPFSVKIGNRLYSVRTVVGDLAHLLSDPRGFWHTRMSPMAAIASEYVNSRNAQGIKRQSLEQFADFMTWFRPISTEAVSGRGPLAQALASQGITSQRFDPDKQAQELLTRWRSKQTDPRITAQYDYLRQSTFAPSRYGRLRDDLRVGADTAAVQEIKTLRSQGVKPQQMIDALAFWKPLTGSWRTERMFESSLTPKELQVYHDAITEKRKMYQRFRELEGQAAK